MKYSQIIVAIMASLVVLLAPAPVNCEMTQLAEPLAHCEKLLIFYFNGAGIDDDQALAHLVDCDSVKISKDVWLKVPDPTFNKVSLPVLAHSTPKLADFPSRETLAEAAQSMSKIVGSYIEHFQNVTGDSNPEDLSFVMDYLLCKNSAMKNMCIGDHLNPLPSLQLPQLVAFNHLFQMLIIKRDATLWAMAKYGRILQKLVTMYPGQYSSENDKIVWSKFYRWFHAKMIADFDMLNVEIMDTAPVKVNGQAILHRSV